MLSPIEKLQFYTYKNSYALKTPSVVALIIWWMTTKKAAKTTFFCDGVHISRNPQI